jgi:hypothetical protein
MVLAMAVPMMVLPLLAARTVAARTCDVPEEFPLAAEEHDVTAAGGAAVVVADQPPASPLRSGDTIRQASAWRVTSCADLERAAAEAVAKGLPLLLAVERGGTLVAVIVEQGRVAETAPPTGAAATTGKAPSVGPAGAERSAPAAAAPSARVAAAPGMPVTPAASPDPQQLDLPPVSAASPELRRTAAAAARELQTVDAAAILTVPLAIYERRLHEAERAVGALGYDASPGSTTLRQVVEALLAVHRTARDVRRARREYLNRLERHLHNTAVSAMPYFSDDAVPRWVAQYPFLRVSIVEPPTPTRLLFPGEQAGVWNPDQALELLWERARAGTARLVAWGEE